MSSKPPSFDLDWEQAVFRGIRAVFRWFGSSREEAVDQETAGVDKRWTTLAQLLAERPIHVVAVHGTGGTTPTGLLLPALSTASLETRDSIWLLRIVLGGALLREGLSPLPSEPVARAKAETERLTRVLEKALQDFPMLAMRLEVALADEWKARPALDSLKGAQREIESVRQSWLKGLGAAEKYGPSSPTRGLLTSPPIGFVGELFENDSTPGSTNGDGTLPTSRATELRAKLADKIELVQKDETQKDQMTPIHSFEKVETLDAYNGGARITDGDDELLEHQEALDEVTLGKVIRSSERTDSVLRADYELATDIPDVANIAANEIGIPFPEWDWSKRSYRRDWCTVYPATLLHSDAAWLGLALRRNRNQIRNLISAIATKRRQRLAKQPRQTDGEAIDLDAVVHHLAQASAPDQGVPRMYIRKSRQRRDVATLVLLDVSLSSDSYVEDRRVLDVARDATLVLGEVAQAIGDTFGVFAFATHTRNRCRILSVHPFESSWKATRGRLGSLKPQGYTRIGPALRYAIDALSGRPERTKLLFLVSDNKPTDYDKYEGRYGVEDIRQAVREAHAKTIDVHAIAIGSKAHSHLAPMMGEGRWHVVRHVDEAGAALVKVYAQTSRW